MLATRYDIINYLRHAMAFDDVEQVRVLYVDVRRRLVAEEVVASGTREAVQVRSRDIVLRGLDVNAAGLMIVHNHPSGDPSPSAADRRFTRELAQAASLFDLRLHDHLIVAAGGESVIAL